MDEKKRDPLTEAIDKLKYEGQVGNVSGMDLNPKREIDIYGSSVDLQELSINELAVISRSRFPDVRADGRTIINDSNYESMSQQLRQLQEAEIEKSFKRLIESHSRQLPCVNFNVNQMGFDECLRIYESAQNFYHLALTKYHKRIVNRTSLLERIIELERWFLKIDQPAPMDDKIDEMNVRTWYNAEKTKCFKFRSFYFNVGLEEIMNESFLFFDLQEDPSVKAHLMSRLPAINKIFMDLMGWLNIRINVPLVNKRDESYTDQYVGTREATFSVPSHRRLGGDLDPGMRYSSGTRTPPPSNKPSEWMADGDKKVDGRRKSISYPSKFESTSNLTPYPKRISSFGTGSKISPLPTSSSSSFSSSSSSFSSIPSNPGHKKSLSIPSLTVGIKPLPPDISQKSEQRSQTPAHRRDSRS